MPAIDQSTIAQVQNGENLRGSLKLTHDPNATDQYQRKSDSKIGE